MAFLRKDRSADANGTEADLHADRRRAMVKQQLRARGIRSPAVLRAMGHLPRELFVPAADRLHAYNDRPLAIGHGATISQPYIVARMTEALDLRESDRVLEVGTGSGYQTSILSLLAREVFTVEIFPELACGARTVLETGGHRNIRFRTADGRLGWPEEAPFDAILLTAAPARLPRALLDQLGLGGRLVAPVGDLEQRLDIWRRSSSGKIDRTHITSVRFVPLLGEGP